MSLFYALCDGQPFCLVIQMGTITSMGTLRSHISHCILPVKVSFLSWLTDQHVFIISITRRTTCLKKFFQNNAYHTTLLECSS